VKLLRAVLGRLDPWAALLLGVLLALGVIILLATPGPWHKVVGPAPRGQLASQAPKNVAVFAVGGAGGRCTGVVWLHVDQARPALTAVVLAPETQGFVPGAGLTPMRRIVDQVGPAAAATALGEALDVPMDAWIALDSQALRLALEPRSLAGEARPPLLLYKRAEAAWEGLGTARRVWSTQYQTLGSSFLRLPFERINVVSFSNYVLGWGHVRSDLDLQGAASLATTFKELLPGQVEVRGAAAIVETCRRDEAWRVDRSAMEQLRQSLAFGLTPPPTGTSVTRRARPARVLVVLPGPGYRSIVYVAAVRRLLQRSAGASVAVHAIRASRWGGLVEKTTAAAESWRPLAVLVGPPIGLGREETADAAVAALRLLGERLRAAGQPAVLSAALPASTAAGFPAADALTAAMRAGGQPVSPLSGPSDSAAGVQVAMQDLDAKLTAAARANVATLVRACWSGTLAPRLASTRLGFSFAARRRTTVGISAATTRASSSAMALLPTWGFQVTSVGATDWTPRRPGRGVYFRTGMRRAALALAGDLGLRPAAVVRDEGSPSPLTLSLGR